VDVEERIVRADPVREPQEYNAELLTLLGGEDPAVVLATTAASFRSGTQGLTPQEIHKRPEPEEWCVAELLGHLWDAEIAYSFRVRAILAQDRPDLIGYDQDAWAGLAKPEYAELLDAFDALRASNLVLLRATQPEGFERVGVHIERGPMSLRLFTDTMAGHDRAHLRQLEQTVAAIRS
jgi:hypothetical protein